MATIPVHYLRPAKRTWTPPALYVLDTEARIDATEAGETHELRLWAAAVIDRKQHGAATHHWHWTQGKTAAGLAASITAASLKHDVLWAYAHNLGYDLATTRLPEHLVALGWEPGDMALSSDTPWMRLTHSGASLVLADSTSFLPSSLAEVGRLIGRRKPRLPAQDAPDATWVRRCRADVAILGLALCRLMDWHETHGRGQWSLTGTATAWGHLRARLPASTIVVDPDPAARAFERSATYGGRRQTWRVATLKGARYAELDFAGAYPSVLTSLPVPTKRLGTVDGPPLELDAWQRDDVGVLAEVELVTDRPRWPLRYGDVNWYPTGRFTTTLAGPELRRALQLGCVARAGRGYFYRLEPVLADWARWILDVVNADGEHRDPVAALACKLWSRSVIGRWAQHSWTSTELGPAPGPGWRYEPTVDAATGLPGALIDLGGRSWLSQQTDQARDAFPAVTAWVESAVRDHLSTAVDQIGDGAIVVANTDGLIVAERALGGPAAGGAVVAPAGLTGTARTNWVVERVNDATRPLRLRIKRRTHHLAVLGPQHVRFASQRKLAGIPEAAGEVEPGRFEFHQWPSLAWQLEAGDGKGYVRPLVTRAVHGPFATGWLLEDGTVFPPAAAIGPDGTTRLLPWHQTPNRPEGAQLAGGQHAVLDGLG